jgi:hypothetical protein
MSTVDRTELTFWAAEMTPSNDLPLSFSTKARRSRPACWTFSSSSEILASALVSSRAV